MLKCLASRFSDQLRREDLFGRISGEEFAVLFRNSGVDDSSTKIESILEMQRQTPVELGEQTLTVTFSCGVTGAQPEDNSLDQMYARADRLLYATKGAGRNQVCSD